MYQVLIRTIDNHKDYARFQLSELKQATEPRKISRLLRKSARHRKEMRLRHPRGRHYLGSFDTNHAQQRGKAIRENWVLDRITEAALDEQTTEQADAMSKELDEERSSESIKKINASKKWDRTNHSICGRSLILKRSRSFAGFFTRSLPGEKRALL